MARPTGRDLKTELILAATDAIQRVGVSAFSFGMAAKELGIQPPTIHHHFRTKQDLVTAVAARYRVGFDARVRAIEAGTTAHRIRDYSALFAETSHAGQLCLCGAVAAEWVAIGAGPRAEVEGFFTDQVQWLESCLRDGIAKGEIRPDLDPLAGATVLLSALEGALLLSRAGSPAHAPTSVGAILPWLMACPP